MNNSFDFGSGSFYPRRISTRPLRPTRSARLRRNNISPHDRRLLSLDENFNNYFNFLRNQQDCLYHIVTHSIIVFHMIPLMIFLTYSLKGP